MLTTKNRQLRMNIQNLERRADRYSHALAIQRHTNRLQTEQIGKLKRKNEPKRTSISTLSYFEYGTGRVEPKQITKIENYVKITTDKFSLLAASDPRSVTIDFKRKNLNRTKLAIKPHRIKIPGVGKLLTRTTACRHLPVESGKAELVSTGQYHYQELKIYDAIMCPFCANTNRINSGASM